MRTGSQPVEVGLAEKPWPGSDGITRWKARLGRVPWVGQRLDDLQLLEDRSGPAVRDDQRQRVLVRRADVDEVDVEPVDLGDEVRQGVQLRFEAAPVVLRAPVPRELLHRRERHALRVVADGLALGPLVALMRLRRSAKSASGNSIRNGRTARVERLCRHLTPQ